MSQVIYVQVDRKEFGRVRLEHSSTIAELRIMLDKNYNLLPNTHFLDTNGYPFTREDEEIDTIKHILHENDIVQMKAVEISPVETTSINTSNLPRHRKETVNPFIIKELLSIIKCLWQLALKPMIIISLVFFVLYYGYTKLVCRHGRFLPLVTMYCPADQLQFIAIPPVSKLAENSVSLADTLMNADVSAPMRFVQAKTSLIHLRSQVIYSDIDTNVKNKLSEQMLELQKLVQTGADQLTVMLASFGGTLDKLRIYTQYALEDLSEVINPQMHRRKNPLQIGYSEVEAKDKLTKSFEDYMTSVSGQIDTILLKAQQASTSLESIKDKLETIQELNFKGKHISQARIDELKHGSFWSWLFDEGKLGIAKHERNLKVLDEFIDFVNVASNNVNDVIIKLKVFKHDAEDLKQTGVILEELPHISVNRHAQLLEAALKRLIDSKEKFEEKSQQLNQ